MKTYLMSRLAIVAGVLVSLCLVPLAQAQEIEIEQEGNTAIAIANLPVNGEFYNVVFLIGAGDFFYDEGFDFGNEADANEARTQVNLALNSDPGIHKVGPDNQAGIPWYAIGFAMQSGFLDASMGVYIRENEVDGWLPRQTVSWDPAAPTSYAIFSQVGGNPPDEPPPPPPKGFAVDVTGVADMTGDAVPDVALLAYKGEPVVRYYSGSDQTKDKGVKYFSTPWWGVAADTVTDADSNGVADDPAVAVLGRKPSEGKRTVEIRRSDDGSSLGKIAFLSENWIPIDVAVINDVNGDGVTGDTAIAVLGFNPDQAADKKIKVQVRMLDDGEAIANWEFFNDNYLPNALEVVQRENATPLLAVLGTNVNDAAIRVESRRLNKGTKVITTKFFGSSWFARDIAILEDTNGNGNPNDPSIMVLAENLNDNKNKVQVRLASDGSQQKNVNMQGASQNARRVTNVEDVSGNQREEVGSLAVNPNDGSETILLVDYGDTDDKTKINP